jgi:hypothetical protein
MENMLQLENMRAWEKVLMLIKRHWIVYVMLWIYTFAALCITIMFYSILWFTVINNLLMIVFWLLFSVFLYIEWLNHELDMYVVTNNRVIWIDQVAFLNRTVSECNLWQVQEVNSKTSWLIANLLNYWTLSIQTAWNKTTLKMDFSPDAIQWARKILNIVDDYRDKQNLNWLQDK